MCACLAHTVQKKLIWKLNVFVMRLMSNFVKTYLITPQIHKVLFPKSGKLSIILISELKLLVLCYQR